MKRFAEFLTEEDKLPPTAIHDKSSMMHNYRHQVEHVPISWLKKLPGNALGKGHEHVEHLKTKITKEGQHDPLIITVGKNSRTAKLGEGNHRLEALHRAGYTHAPTRVIVGSEYGKEHGSRANYHHDLIPKEGEYFKGDAKPSEVFHSLKGKVKDVS